MTRPDATVAPLATPGLSADPLLLAFDTETTGLTLHPQAAIEKQPKLIEFGGMLLSLRTGEVVDQLSTLVYPGEQISEEINKITEITNAQLGEALSFAELLPRIREFFAQAVSIVAHNFPFDRDIMLYELQRHRTMPLAQDFPWPGAAFCTMNMYTPQWGRPPRLIEIYKTVMGKDYPQTHRALDDVRAMVEVIQKDRLWEVMKP